MSKIHMPRILLATAVLWEETWRRYSRRMPKIDDQIEFLKERIEALKTEREDVEAGLRWLQVERGETPDDVLDFAARVVDGREERARELKERRLRGVQAVDIDKRRPVALRD